MNKSKMKFLWALVVIAISGNAYKAAALPNTGEAKRPDNIIRGELKGTAALCEPATATVDLDINNVRAKMIGGGNMWFDRPTGTAKYEVPKGSGKHSLFAGSVWVGGYDIEKNLKVCAQTYRQSGNDYWPGPLDVTTNSIDKATCSEWDKIWRINKADLFAFQQAYRTGDVAGMTTNAAFEDIRTWPALGNATATGKTGAPLDLLVSAVGVPNHTYAQFQDVDKDGIYDWTKGDYPVLFSDETGDNPAVPDQYAWWIFNDVGNTKTETGSGAIGMEVQTSAFAYSRNDYMNDATFINYRLINRGVLTMSTTYMSTWTDADLGYAYDDYIGCDTARGLGILYNSKVPDGNGEPTSYGNQVPMVGVDFFIGPKHDTFINGQYKILDTLDMTIFNYFDNRPGTATGNPNGALELFRVMTGFNRRGDAMRDDRASLTTSSGYNGSGPDTKFAFPGNPTNPNEWSMCQCGLPKTEDRRFVHSSGPFTLYSGGTTNDLTIGMVWVADVGGCPNATFSRIRVADDLAQEFFDSKFRIIRGPDAPDMTIREGDRELIFYLTNDNPQSNNYLEKYGNKDSSRYRESAGTLARQYPDSLYTFEGYRVFQLKNSTVTAAQIFGDNGEVNNELAVEVFQTDVKNGVTEITNFEANIQNTSLFNSQLKVKGKDSGIVHSFRLVNDAFAKGNDQRFVNYHSYYFIAVAYAYNNYRQFSYSLSDSTQRRPYLAGNTSWNPAARGVVFVQSGMPNPTNGAMGTETPAKYGDGVVIKRIEGAGNSRGFMQMDEASEEEALQAPAYRSNQPVYERGQGPIDVKVVDPRKIQAYDWEVWLTGRDTSIANSGIGLAPGLSQWKLIRKGGSGAGRDTIYSDKSLAIINEQIINEYGLSINISQTKRPGDDQISFNGYIGSSVTFADPTNLWLAGVSDGEEKTYNNWIRSGHLKDTSSTCDWKDKDLDTVGQFYETLFDQNTRMRASWAPYALAAGEAKGTCGFGVAFGQGQPARLSALPSIDIILTSDKSKWSRCAVLELQDDVALAENGAAKLGLRRHAGWNKDMDAKGNPIYSPDANDSGTSWFPGYAINQVTGKRVNIMFGEDSYLKKENGGDMIWNPTGTQTGLTASEVVNGGKHYIYVTDSAYDGCKYFVDLIRLGVSSSSPLPKINAHRTIQWVGLPLVSQGYNLRSLADGLIPTETRLRLRVEMPFKAYVPDGQTAINDGFPVYFFTTRDIATRPLGAANNSRDGKGVMDNVRIVPNPYYGTSGYEQNRLDNRVRITNLPNRATISIYSMDGTLIRRLEHSNSAETTRGYEDWDIRNAKGLQISSGMYLIHVKSEGVGETVIKWFGAMRPADITDY